MNRATLLARRRVALIAECALQRNTLSAQTRGMVRAAGWLDQGTGTFFQIKKIPLWLLGATAGIAILKPKRTIGLLRNGLLAWQLIRNVIPLLKSPR